MLSVGIDLIEIARIKGVWERHGQRFLERVFTPREVAQSRGKAARLAGRFAAKEATAKALGTGMRGVAWREIEVVQLRSGKPTLQLHGRAQRIAEQQGLRELAVSISDTDLLATAIVVVQ